MNILVCIKQVPATAQVEVDETTGVLKRSGAAGKVNPYDLYALEAAFRLRETAGGRVDVVTMGPPQAKEALLEALHMGGDRAFLLSDRRFAGADVLATARTLAQGIRIMGDYDLILCGKQTTDGDTAQVGPEVAEFLGMEHACYVHKMEIQGENALVVESGTGEGTLIQRMALPCLLTVEKDIYTPRLPSYVRSLQVEGAQLRVLSLDDFDDNDENHYGLSGSPTQVERIFPPEKQVARQKLEGTPQALALGLFETLKENKFI